ncbi:radical SAM/SPASM domain-containing protein [Halarcobacter ebronensis]|uniref:Radical SAM protein n=1 Tax=Halarcobacter ebronensis TaxID=1462615 RepID=A0A4Q1APP8_9BACT|nr:radical SAM protein [Halarcobacter ebronensis]QKF82791.1 radical SAM superfamily enzyme, MoaA/NifB/PqqE/SkfB family [Halarcobacter ebronensis]RXK06815.1 radical SAM protein [Halarcobacter ebronensis]
MFFKKKSNILFRYYDSFGYITDNRNFAYKRLDDNREDIGDKILSESGAVFFSVLDNHPQIIGELLIKISNIYSDINIKLLERDVIEFYSTLEKAGFITSGDTFRECDEKDEKFSYTKILDTTFKKNLSNNQMSTQDYFQAFFNNKPQLTSLHIEITSKCNERCIHCYIPHENKINNIDSDLFYNILNQSREMNLLHITISGGEPMLHKDFCNFLKECRKNNFSVSVLSNLTLLNEKILKEMKSNPLLGVQVSLYSMNPNIHDEITQMKGSFEKTKNAILKLVENDIPLKISCPILKENKNCHNNVVKWAKKNNISVGNDYLILAKYNHSCENLKHRLSIDDVNEIIENIVENDSEYVIEIEKEAEKKKNISENDFVCSVCHSSICISENGNVYPCAGWQDYSVGNILNASLKNIWYNSEKVNYLRDLKKKDFPQCLTCSDKEYCTMCMVRNANEDISGNPLVINKFYCNVANINKNVIRKFNKKIKTKV